MAGGSGTAGTGERCPVCPFGGLDGTETTCPSCGTDLSVLRRVQGLPVAILEDAVGLARAGNVEGARTALHAAAAFTRTRGQALALLRGIGSGCPNPACRL
ncbi:MAG: hypothetical protein HY658_05560, partial [Actinobacteria bacterium]|nr:hypothetical protein [Actinomycetota bacterium]